MSKIISFLKKHGTGLLALLVAVLLLCLFARPWYYRLLYFGDRVAGTVSVELDGEPAGFTVEGRFGREQTTTRGDGSARVSLRASDHGVYTFLFRIDGVEQTITLSGLKWNWMVVKFDVRISVDRENGTVSYTGTVRATDDTGYFVERPVDETADLTEEEPSFPICW